MYPNAVDACIFMVEKNVNIANAKQVGLKQPGLVLRSNIACFNYGKNNALKRQML
jgi:hypothetical protein